MSPIGFFYPFVLFFFSPSKKETKKKAFYVGARNSRLVTQVNRQMPFNNNFNWIPSDVRTFNQPKTIDRASSYAHLYI